MTGEAWEIVGRKDWELPLGKNVGDALRDLIRHRWSNHAYPVLTHDQQI